MGEWLLSGGTKYIFRAEPLIKLAFMGYPGRVGSARTRLRAVAPYNEIIPFYLLNENPLSDEAYTIPRVI
jgi:hypothetical protein